MREEEAKTRWCPFARVASPLKDNQGPGGWVGVAAANRAVRSTAISLEGASDRSNPESCRCLASDCMAWRWKLLGWNDRADALYSEVDGFCGLAGSVQ